MASYTHGKGEVKAGSAHFGKEDKAIKKANQAAYEPKGGSDTDVRSHGSRPSHINKPEIKAYSPKKEESK